MYFVLFLGLLANNLHLPRAGKKARLVTTGDKVLHDLQKCLAFWREAGVALHEFVECKSNGLQMAQHM
jgi:hypothetical protein